MVARVEAQPVGDALVGDAPADDLVQTTADERVDGAAAKALLEAQPAGRAAALGQRRRQLLEAVDPRDLLDEVGLAVDVVAAEVRDGDVEAVGLLGAAELERGEDLGLAL